MRVTLADGTEIKNLRLSWDSNTFISEKPIDKGIFKENLSKVVVGGDSHRNRDNIHYNMRLIKFEEYRDSQPPEWRFELAK